MTPIYPESRPACPPAPPARLPRQPRLPRHTTPQGHYHQAPPARPHPVVPGESTAPAGRGLGPRITIMDTTGFERGQCDGRSAALHTPPHTPRHGAAVRCGTHGLEFGVEISPKINKDLTSVLRSVCSLSWRALRALGRVLPPPPAGSVHWPGDLLHLPSPLFLACPERYSDLASRSIHPSRPAAPTAPPPPAPTALATVEGR